MTLRVYELAKQLDVESSAVLARLGELGEFARSASSLVSDALAKQVRDSFGEPDRERLGTATTPLGWRAGAIKPPIHAAVLANIEEMRRAIPAVTAHQETLAALGSQLVHASKCRVNGSEDWP